MQTAARDWKLVTSGAHKDGCYPELFGPDGVSLEAFWIISRLILSKAAPPRLDQLCEFRGEFRTKPSDPNLFTSIDFRSEVRG